jgi:hypothetical protein
LDRFDVIGDKSYAFDLIIEVRLALEAILHELPQNTGKIDVWHRKIEEMSKNRIIFELVE